MLPSNVKSRQACFVAPGEKFVIGGIFILLHLEVISNCNCDASDNFSRVSLSLYIFGSYLPLINKCKHPLKNVKLVLKYPVLFRGVLSCYFQFIFHYLFFPFYITGLGTLSGAMLTVDKDWSAKLVVHQMGRRSGVFR